MLSIYKEAKKASKREVAISKAKKYDEVYEKLGTREGEKDIYKLAKSRARSQRDVGDVKCVRDGNGEVLVNNEEVQDRWQTYFETLMNEGAELAQQTEEGGEKRGVELVK